MTHTHHHPHPINSLNRAYIVGIVLNMGFVLVEFGAGFYTNSLALLSDAGHNLSDVASLTLSLIAFRLAKAKTTQRFTYGYVKSTILASLVNAVILLIAVGSIGWEAIQRFMHPVETNGSAVSMVAGIGILINTVSALMFFKDREKDLNVKGAYLHLATDALVSIGVVVAGFLMVKTGIKWIDPLISLVIMFVVIASTWHLLRESLWLSLDAVPANIELEKIKELACSMDKIKDINHIHVWAMSTTKNAMTAHIVLKEEIPLLESEKVKDELKHRLEHLGIHHVTLEIEANSV